MAAFRLTVNGARRTVDVDPPMPLLCILSNDLEVNGPKLPRATLVLHRDRE